MKWVLGLNLENWRIREGAEVRHEILQRKADSVSKTRKIEFVFVSSN